MFDSMWCLFGMRMSGAKCWWQSPILYMTTWLSCQVVLVPLYGPIKDFDPRLKGELIPGRFAELSISAPAGARLRLLVPAACQCFDVLRHALTWICSILKDLNKSVLSCFVRRSVMCQIHLIHTSRVRRHWANPGFSQSRWASEQKDTIREIRHQGGFETPPSVDTPTTTERMWIMCIATKRYILHGVPLSKMKPYEIDKTRQNILIVRTVS